MVVDECHRGYLLDREMSDAELSFRNQDDYISKYRRVLEHFDAVKIGLTATPALHTVSIFGDPVFNYSYREAVIDGYLIDHEPPGPDHDGAEPGRDQIQTRANEVELIDTRTGQIDLAHAPDEISFEVDEFNKRVVTVPFNARSRGAGRHIDPNLPGKTLIFAVSDAHADIVVEQVKKAFEERYGEIEDAAVTKITGSVDRVGSLILSFRNDALPKIAVTVDLLTTGIDVPKHRESRVPAPREQPHPLRADARPCYAPMSEIGKETFRIFDAVDLYPHLQNLTEMKPVVVNPRLLLSSSSRNWRGEDDKHREAIRDQIIVKMRRRLRRLPEQARARYEAEAGETAGGNAQAPHKRAAHEVAAWVKATPEPWPNSRLGPGWGRA